jgi:2-hydroxychromene-2-carboxylate isomerase
MMKRVDFFFDLSSPYSYLASTQLPSLCRRAGAELAYRPMVLHAVFQASGNTMPVRVPHKARWMGQDLLRWGRHYGVPFRMSSHFPVNAIKVMRLILVDGARAQAVTDAAFAAMWAEDRNLADEAVLRDIAAAGGLDVDAAMRAIEEPAIKDRLRANTDEAIARGAFGAPAIFVGEELFWGNDRLHFVEAALSAPPAT